MTQRPVPPEINMTLDGQFLPDRRRPGSVPPGSMPSGSMPPGNVPWPLRLRPQTLLALVGAGTLVAAGLVVWLTVMLLPVLLVAGLAGWAVLRVRGLLRQGGGLPRRR